MGHDADDVQIQSDNPECMKSLLNRFTGPQLRELFNLTTTQKSQLVEEIVKNCFVRAKPVYLLLTT